MTAEGTFPKVDGDILYASEVNKNFKAGQYLLNGSFPYITPGSLEVYTSIGSFIVSGQYIPANGVLTMTYITKREPAKYSDISIVVSGPGGVGSSVSERNTPNNPSFSFLKVIMGSSLSGGFINFNIPANGGFSVGSPTELVNINMGSPFIVEFLGRTNGSIAITNYSVEVGGKLF